MTKLLLTGATGFLGSYLLESFVSQGYDVAILKRSTSDTKRIDKILSDVRYFNIDEADLKDVFDEEKPDIIVHTACSYGRGGESILDVVNSNLIFGLQLLEEGIKNGVKTFVNTSSLLPKKVNTYSLSKYQLEEWLEMYSDKIQSVNLRIEHMYGPKDDTKKFLPWLINEMENTENEIKLTSGIQKRDFIYIDDVVAAFNIVLKEREHLSNWNQFDVGTNVFTEVKKFVLKVAAELERRNDSLIVPRLKFGEIDYRFRDVLPMLDNSKLLDLGWKCNFTIKEGIKKILKK